MIFSIEENIVGFEDVIEEIAAEAVRQNFFDVSEDEDFLLGVNTPHIVFNYLDYLL